MTFYHYLNGAWTPVTLTLSAGGGQLLRQSGTGGFNGSISMDSATDGWAVASDYIASSVLFHFTGGTMARSAARGAQWLFGRHTGALGAFCLVLQRRNLHYSFDFPL